MKRTSFIAVGALAVVVTAAAAGFGVSKMLVGPSAGAGSDCRTLGGDARTNCYSHLLSTRLVSDGVAAAVALLDQLAAADRDVAEHAHEYAHGMTAIPPGVAMA